MRLVYGGILAIGILIAISVIIISPVYLQALPSKTVLLSFNISDESALPQWCTEIAEYLKDNNLKGAVFVSGKIAEQYPECVNSFGNGIDIGSQTYGFVELPLVQDYLVQLDEVKKGKETIDRIGNIDSKLFKAPNKNTDENIYSLLSRNGIFADFSYDNRYHKYHDGKFLTFDLQVFDGLEHPAKFYRELDDSSPIQINFYSDSDPEQIAALITSLKDSNDFRFVSASELTNQDLTIRGAS